MILYQIEACQMCRSDPISPCQECALREKCTRSKGARTIKRHHRQKELDQMLRISHSAWAKRDMKTRKHLMERSFADAANNHGFKRSRWRGLERVCIQNLIIAAVQNIRILITKGRKPVGVAQGAWGRKTRWQDLSATVSNCWIQINSFRSMKENPGSFGSSNVI
jgi:hypothetical protein